MVNRNPNDADDFSLFPLFLGSGRRFIGLEHLVHALCSAGATVDVLDGHSGTQLETIALQGAHLISPLQLSTARLPLQPHH